MTMPDESKKKSSDDKSKDDKGVAGLEQIRSGIGVALEGFGLDPAYVEGGKEIASGLARIANEAGEGTFLNQAIDVDG